MNFFSKVIFHIAHGIVTALKVSLSCCKLVSLCVCVCARCKLQWWNNLTPENEFTPQNSICILRPISFHFSILRFSVRRIPLKLMVTITRLLSCCSITENVRYLVSILSLHWIINQCILYFRLTNLENNSVMKNVFTFHAHNY